MKKLIVLVVLLAGCGYAGSQGYGWWNQSVNQPISAHSQTVAVHVPQGASADDIGSLLYNKGLIRSTEAFSLYVRYAGVRGNFQAGDFSLNKNMSMAQIVSALTSVVPTQVSIRLAEGTTLKTMAAAVQRSGLGTAQDYTAAAKASSYVSAYDFLAGRPASAPDNLEGYLFPDTYKVSPSEGVKGLVTRQLNRFGQLVTPDLRAQITQAAPGRPAETIWNVVVLASIVEREVNKDPDRAPACGVFYNRLAQGMPLGSDPTVMYGLGDPATPPTNAAVWNDPTNPYNTRVHTGLPPSPISNPSLASLKACISPQASSYLYFFTDKGGTTRFARTAQEFQQQQAQYGVGSG